MVNRVNGGVLNNESLTGNLDFVTVQTVIELAEGDFGDVASATRNLIRLVEKVSLHAQPVVVAVSSEAVDLSDAPTAAVYGFGTDYTAAGTDVYTVKMVIEHTNSATDLAETINGAVAPFGGVATFDTADAAAKNTTVTITSIL